MKKRRGFVMSGLVALIALLAYAVATSYLGSYQVQPRLRPLRTALPTTAIPAASTTYGRGAELSATFFDVGQADAIFIQSSEGRTMLIDGGNSSRDAQGVILPHLRMRGIERLDYVVLTHPHQDHVGGLPVILREMPVGAVVMGGQVHVNKSYEEFLELIRNRSIPVVKARPGARIDMGGLVEVEVLNPQEPLFTKGDSVVNNNSVVLRLTFRKVSLLLTGDLEKRGEKRVLSQGSDLRSQVMKVGHHGSKDASLEEFLRAVQPEVAIISVGQGNQFGHPHPATIERLENLGAQVLRTDLSGTISIATDGTGYWVETER